MADNYVSIKIKADDTAKPDLTELKAQLDELGRKVDTAKVDVDDEDASVKLLAINARLADLNRKVANPRISVSGAAHAEADIAALNLQMDKLQKTADASGPGGLLDKALTGGGSGGGLSSLLEGGLLSPVGIGALVAGFAALLPEVVAVVNGFVAAGAGAASFGLLAMPAIKNVETAYTNLNTAQQAYQGAQAKYHLDPTKTNATALKNALDGLDLARQALGKLPGSEQKAVAGVNQLVTAFGRLSKAFAPQAYKVFADFLKIANNLMPDIVPFANTFADTMDGMLKKVADITANPAKVKLNWEQLLNPPETAKQRLRDSLNWDQLLNPPELTAARQKLHSQLNWEQLLNPAGLGQVTSNMTQKVTQTLTPFQQFTDQLHRLEGPALQAIGSGIGQVAVAIGKLLETFSGKDVANGINILFGVIAGAINAVRGAVDFLKWAWDALSRNPTFKRIASDISTAWGDISKTGKKKPDFSGLTQAVKDAVKTATGWLDAHLLPELTKILTAASKWLDQHAGPILQPVGKAIVEGLIQGIESSIPSLLPVLGNVAKFIAEHKGPLDYDRQLLVPHGRAIMQGLMGGMALELPVLRSQLAGISGVISGGVPASHAAAGGGGDIVFRLGSGGSGLDQMFMTWLKNSVRSGGGDPAIFTKKVKFL